jgi:hypothetical protein
MEVTVIIKLPDGTIRTVEIVGASINTSWGNGYSHVDPASVSANVVGSFSLSGQIKDNSLIGSV